MTVVRPDNQARVPEMSAEDQYYEDDDICDVCGGDGDILLSDAGPSAWGEDVFCDVDRFVTCPACKGKGVLK